MTTTNLISTPNITGNIGSCTTQSTQVIENNNLDENTEVAVWIDGKKLTMTQKEYWENYEPLNRHNSTKITIND